MTLRLLRCSSLAKRLRAEGLALAVGIFALSFLPMTNILFPVGTLVAERLLYLPSGGFLIVVVSMLYSETALGSKSYHKLESVARVILLFTVVVWWTLCYQR